MKIGFTGTQIGMTDVQKNIVSSLLKKLKDIITEVHHGDCIGADKEFHDIAKQFALKVILHPPSNDSKRAFCQADAEWPEKDYLDRNHDIVNQCDVLIATPKESSEELRSGTWATIRYARKVHKTIYVVFSDGKFLEN